MSRKICGKMSVSFWAVVLFSLMPWVAYAYYELDVLSVVVDPNPFTEETVITTEVYEKAIWGSWGGDYIVTPDVQNYIVGGKLLDAICTDSTVISWYHYWSPWYWLFEVETLWVYEATPQRS